LFKTSKIIIAAALSLGAASFASDSGTAARTLHFGLSAVGSYIDIWHLDNDVYVKKETEVEEFDDEEIHTYKEQWLSGGYELRGIGGSVGVSALKDFTENFSLHLDLYVSLRYRFVEAKEHHTTEESTVADGETIETKFKEGSKGKYDISLTYWHLDMPINARYKLPHDFYVEAGAFVSYIVAANLKIKLISLDFQSYSAGMELGTSAGFGKRFQLSQGRSIEAFSRFLFGLTPLLNDKVKEYLYEQIRPREWLVQAGVTFYLF